MSAASQEPINTKLEIIRQMVTTTHFNVRVKLLLEGYTRFTHRDSRVRATAYGYLLFVTHQQLRK